MARSLVIKIGDNEINAKVDGGMATITLPCGGTHDTSTNVVEPLEMEVMVDGQKNNASFTVESYTKWFNYEIKRVEDGTDSYVKILLIADKNLNTLSRLGEMRIMHNAAPLTINLEIIQQPSVYDIKVEYQTDGIFKSFPKNSGKDCLYEDKIVTITANGGSKKWYIKDIEQYEAHNTFTDEGTINGDEITEADRKNEMRVPYDGAFKYFIDGDTLTVRSFGKVDICEEGSHMRYYFRICHKDVGNSLKKYNTATDPFEVSQLFIFDNDGGERYGEGTEGYGNIDVIESHKYVFLVNSKKSHFIDIKNVETTIPIIITSSKDGVLNWEGGTVNVVIHRFKKYSVNDVVTIEEYKEIDQEYKDANYCEPRYDSETEEIVDYIVNKGFGWVTYDETNGRLIIDKNEDNERNVEISFIQYDVKKYIEEIKLNVKQSSVGDVLIFKVNGNDTDFTYVYSEEDDKLPLNECTIEMTVESTKNDEEVPYTAIPQDEWVTYDNSNDTLTFKQNYSTNERSTYVLFKQEGGSTNKPINVEFIQKGENVGEYDFTINYSFENVVEDDKTITSVTYNEEEHKIYITLNDGTINLLDFQTDVKIGTTTITGKYSVAYESRKFVLTQIITNKVDSLVTVTPVKVLEFVIFNEGVQQKFISSDVRKNVITVRYGKDVKDLTSYTIYYLDENNKEIESAPPTVIKGVVGDKINIAEIEQKGISGYKLKENGIVLPGDDPVEFVLDFDETRNVVNCYYEKIPTTKYRVRYFDDEYVILDEETKISDDLLIGTKITKEDLSPYKVEIEGYTFKEFELPNGEDEYALNELQDANIIKAIYNRNKQERLTKYFFDDDTIIVDYEEKLHDVVAKLYSFSILGDEKSAIKLKSWDIESGSEFIRELKISDLKNDKVGYYYEIRVGTTKNDTDEVKKGSLRFTNEENKEIQLNVIQRISGEIVFADFDYIVMNYTWTDYTEDSMLSSNGSEYTKTELAYSRDFDSSMFFDTESIGNMYHQAAYYGSKTITDNEKVYAELAYDQIGSSVGNTDRIETQVVYLKELFDDGYFEKMKDYGDDDIVINLYGNLYSHDGAFPTPKEQRKVALQMFTYKGGEMVKDDNNNTMKNVGGEERGYSEKIEYVVSSNEHISGNYSNDIDYFNNLGRIVYNIKRKDVVFTPFELPSNENVFEMYIRLIEDTDGENVNFKYKLEFNGEVDEGDADTTEKYFSYKLTNKPKTNEAKFYYSFNEDRKESRKRFSSMCNVIEEDYDGEDYDKVMTITWEDKDFIGFSIYIEYEKRST